MSTDFVIVDAESGSIRVGIARSEKNGVSLDDVVQRKKGGVKALQEALGELTEKCGRLPRTAFVASDHCAVGIEEMPMAAPPRRGREAFRQVVARRARPIALDQWGERRIGTLLCDDGVLGGHEVQHILASQDRQTARFGELEELRGLIEPEDLDRALDKQLALQNGEVSLIADAIPTGEESSSTGHRWIFTAHPKSDWQEWSEAFSTHGIKRFRVTRGALAAATCLMQEQSMERGRLAHDELGALAVVDIEKGRVSGFEHIAVSSPRDAWLESRNLFDGTAATWRRSGRGVAEAPAGEDENADIQVLEIENEWTPAMRGLARSAVAGASSLPTLAWRDTEPSALSRRARAALFPLLFILLIVGLEGLMAARRDSQEAELRELESVLVGTRRERVDERDQRTRTRILTANAAERQELLDALSARRRRYERIAAMRETFWGAWLDEVVGAVSDRVVLVSISVDADGHGEITGHAQDLESANRFFKDLAVACQPYHLEIVNSSSNQRNGPFGETSQHIEARLAPCAAKEEQP